MGQGIKSGPLTKRRLSKDIKEESRKTIVELTKQNVIVYPRYRRRANSTSRSTRFSGQPHEEKVEKKLG